MTGHENSYHTPVLLDETILGLQIRPGGTYCDCTLGGGGHFRAMAAAMNFTGTLIGIDRDPASLAHNRRHSFSLPLHVVFEQVRFSHFPEILKKHGIANIDGLLLDLGVSSHQIDVPERGFSYQYDAALDMRMNPGDTVTAMKILETIHETDLTRLLAVWGEVRNPARLSRALCHYRRHNLLHDSRDLKNCLQTEYGETLSYKLLSKLYQTLRIAVNDEIQELSACLEKVPEALTLGGRIAVISYHSGEDAHVKKFFRFYERQCVCPQHSRCSCQHTIRFHRITKKPLRPSSTEISRNPRARSGRLRIAEKVRDGTPRITLQ